VVDVGAAEVVVEMTDVSVDVGAFVVSVSEEEVEAAGMEDVGA
jgi:hypothetical protein